MDAKIDETQDSEADSATAPAKPQLLIVTGMSGAGKSAALGALEDLGYEVVDNLPLSLLPYLVSPDAVSQRPLAICVDARNRDFAGASLDERMKTLLSRTDIDVRLLYLDCDDIVLQQRFSQTRRRHPLAPDKTVAEGLEVERRIMAGLREHADQAIDTTDLNEHGLRRVIRQLFTSDSAHGMIVSVVSFAYGKGIPRHADLVFDVRFLRNPYYEDSLQALTGQDPAVAAYIREDPDFGTFADRLKALLAPLLPRYRAEGKSYLTIALGCTGGRHRSVLLAGVLSDWLAEQGYPAEVRHRELDGDEIAPDANADPA
jgi:UPF0042 nucleotide-binding protein